MTTATESQPKTYTLTISDGEHTLAVNLPEYELEAIETCPAHGEEYKAAVSQIRSSGARFPATMLPSYALDDVGAIEQLVRQGAERYGLTICRLVSRDHDKEGNLTHVCPSLALALALGATLRMVMDSDAQARRWLADHGVPKDYTYGIMLGLDTTVQESASRSMEIEQRLLGLSQSSTTVDIGMKLKGFTIGLMLAKRLFGGALQTAQG